MTETEKQNSIDTKQKIRDRYRGVDTSKLTIIPAKPPNLITLPLHTKLSDEDVEYVIENFREVVGEYLK